MKIAAIILVLIAALVLIALIVQSFKLLRKTQKEELAERKEMRQSAEYQIHPELSKEWKKLEQMKQDLENKNK